ncbi:MAG TPA: flagellar basal-body rod protein FlgF [Planctomycetaceae bacterium]|nr:flagellar basal-body rod protein FlgF [Planctomycetaceae bacterium]HIQ19849.1 flagellar basal-body rod protein FlgF [Planctomycetota bacterium]
MPYGLYLSAEGAQAQARRLEVIANNLANVNTVGFKRQLAILQARYAEAIEQGMDQAGSGSINDVGGGVFLAETRTDYSRGPLKRTELSTDMAIDGEGFFVVRRGQENLLTRAGNFRITSAGRLVTQQGYDVLSEDGSPITIDPTRGPWYVTPSGTIRQQGTVQTLAIVAPQSPGDLVRLGKNLFRPLADPQPVPRAQRRVLPGYLEMSSVEPTTEMIAMIEASRAVEANINMMKTQDQMLSGLVNRLMRTV